MLKKSMDIVDIYAWVRLHGKELVECFIDNAYRAKHSWILKLRCKGQSRLLKVEAGQRVHFSASDPPDKWIDNMARYLRAHVRNGKIVSADLPMWERVVVLRVARSRGELLNYVELVPRGLWVVTDNAGKVLYASRFEEFKDRAVKPGIRYQPPPPKGKAPWNTEELVNALLGGRDLVRGIVSEWGLPGYIAEELLVRTGLQGDKLKKPREIQRNLLELVACEYKRLVEESLRGEGYLVYGESGLEFYSPYRPRLFEEVYGAEVKRVEEFNSAVDAYFAELEAMLNAEERRKELERQLEAWKRRVEEQERAVREHREELERVTKTIALIYGNYARLLELIECARRIRNEKGWWAVTECGVSGFDEHRGVVRVNVEGTELEFSVRESLEEHVLRLERLRGELSKKVERALEVLRDLEKKSAEFEEELSRRVYSKPAPKHWYERFRWSITRNNFIVVAGRDASQNEVLVKRYLGEEDIFIHADIHGAPATILLRSRGAPTVEDIADAAVVAACYSKAWKAGYSYVDVYWVKGKQVSKSPPAGEYLARGAFMVYGERNYLRVPMKLGVGLRLFCDTIYGDYVKVYVGPRELVVKTCISYVVLVPGDTEPAKVAKEIAGALVGKALERTGIKFSVSEQQVLDALPGPARVVEQGVGEGPWKCEE